jgi:hypothetical protein
MDELQLPIRFAGDIDLSYDYWDTTACRTNYFDYVELVQYAPSSKKLAFQFKAGVNVGNPPLAPGYGPIINLHFSVGSGSGSNVLDTVTLGGRELAFDAGYAAFQPRVQAGVWQSGLCGDIDGNGIAVDIADLVYLVDYMFTGGPPPTNMDAANVDGMNGIDISDLVYLVDYMFNLGPGPLC